MYKDQPKRKNQNRLAMYEWMLAIDFDSVEIGFSQNDVSKKYVQILDKINLTVKKGD
jgi:hypothetical protein